MCKFSSKSGGVPFQPLGDLTWNDPKHRAKRAVVLPRAGAKQPSRYSLSQQL